MVDPISSSITASSKLAVNKASETKSSDFERALEKAVNEKDDKKLKEACQNMESMFINMMFQQMRQTVDKTQLFDSGFAEDTFEDMLYEDYSKEISKNKGIGIGDILYKQLSKNIEQKGETDNAE